MYAQRHSSSIVCQCIKKLIMHLHGDSSYGAWRPPNFTTPLNRRYARYVFKSVFLTLCTMILYAFANTSRGRYSAKTISCKTLVLTMATDRGFGAYFDPAPIEGRFD